MIHAQGLVDGAPIPVEVREHVESPEADLQRLASGEEVTLKVGMFRNSGNVNQTLQLGSIGNFVNCSQNGDVSFGIMQSDGSVSPAASSVVLQPSESAVAFIPVLAGTAPQGEQSPYSFDIEGSWS